MIKISFLIVFISCNTHLGAQIMNHYWSTNFNSISSLLGGAVVAGMGDNTSIYYNPATISQMESVNQFSFTTSLFTWNTYSFKNMLGDGIDMKSSNFIAQPPFISYSYKPKNSNFSLSAVILTRIKEDFELSWNNSTYYDVLQNLPGDEKYNTSFRYRNYYVDTWVGAALAHQVSPRFSYGISLFVSGVSFRYLLEYSTSAYSVNDTLDPEIYPQVRRIAEGNYSESIRFADYRIILKFGFAYQTDKWKLGLNITTPSIHLFSSGEKASRTELVSNISISNELFIPDFQIFDGQENSQLNTNFKLPFAISFGFIRDIGTNNKRLYFATEFYGKINEYKIVDAQINEDITQDYIYQRLENKDWLSFAMATRSFMNIVIGYSWKLKKEMEFYNSIRSDLSSIKNAEFDSYSNYNKLKTSNYNIYHYSAGLKFNIRKNSFIAGGQVSFGYNNSAKQVANFSDPIELNTVDNIVLQGRIADDMIVMYWGFNIYIGATLNFIKNDN